MIAEGLVDEVRRLRATGFSREVPAMSGLGYRQIMAHLDGEMTLDESVERIKFETHRFARQQQNWFRPDDEKITWYDTQQEEWRTRVITDVERFLAESQNHT
jgi:tRNA dimethylallyltransferase